MLLAALMSGTAHTAGELARFCAVAPSTMSKHLSRLVDTGLVVAEPAGRYRYYRLAGLEVAELLEQIDSLDLPEVTTPRRPDPGTELSYARSCYDHVAGTLGVRMLDSMVDQGHLAGRPESIQLTSTGAGSLRQLGIDVESVERARRPTIRACLDWTERKHHIGGGLGAALFRQMITKRWISRRPDQRVLRLTPTGRDAVERFFPFDHSARNQTS